jgi:hypothetical protein
MINIFKKRLDDRPDWLDFMSAAAVIGGSAHIESLIDHAIIWIIALGTVCLLDAWHGGRVVS